MRLTHRLERLERTLAGRPRADQFTTIEAVPVGDDAAEGKPPGLYRSGSPGSTCGLLVYDPSKGEPVVPEGKLVPWGLVIVLGPDYVEPPAEMPTCESKGA